MHFWIVIVSGFFIFNSEKSLAQVKKEYKVATFAFYNVENLFDTENDAITFDDDRTPQGKDVWTLEKYQEKLSHIGRTLSEIGLETSKIPPVLIGLCEIENLQVLEDLLKQPQLQKLPYGIIHYDSPDFRGVDVALLYNKDFFQPLQSQSRRLLLYEPKDPTKRIFTRDQLVVCGLLEHEKIYLIINHWPSRGGGQQASNYKREKAALLNKQIMDSIFSVEPNAKILSMGDFNDDPTNSSFKKILQTKASSENLQFRQFYNPMEKMFKKGLGTLAYRDVWNLFDQMLFSAAWFKKEYKGFQFYKAGIFQKEYLLTPKGPFKGYPFRSYGYGGYQGGYSDHFPVFAYLIKEK